MEKRVRFGDLVRNSGRPRVLTLWTRPEKDPAVSGALKQNRVLTVMEPPNQTKFGVLGLKPDAHAIFLMFPRPLDLDPGARVVGINYQLAEQPELAPRAATASPAKERSRPQHRTKPQAAIKPEPTPKPPKRFKVRLRRTATLEETREVEAANRREAKLRAMDIARGEPFDLNRATVRDAVKVE